MNRTLIIPLTFLLGLCLMADFTNAADVRDRFETRTYSDAADAKKKYPLVVFLHGAGERGNDNAVQLKHGMGDFASDEAMAKNPAFVIAPQCPTGQKWVDVDWSSEKSDMPSKPAESMRLTIELLAALQKEFSIDASRIYITGLSMGGYGTWDALQRYPKLFAAGAPICGGGDPAQAAKFKDVPLWAFHGDADTAVKVQRSRDMIAALEAAGGKPKYTEYPGVGHDSWSASYKNPEFHTWLFAQQRK